MPSSAERVYRRLLVLLPPDFRHEAEADLLETFAQAHARVVHASRLVRVRFWLLMVADLVTVALAERISSTHVTHSALHLDVLPPRSPAMRIAHAFLFTLSDVRLAARRLAKTPAWTLLSAGTLALGLAASIVAAVLIRDVLLAPLPFPEPGRLVRILEISEGGRCCWWPSVPNARDWREQGRMFKGVGLAGTPAVQPVLLNGAAVRVPVAGAGRGLFEMLGVRLVAGRLFTDDENRPGGAPVAIVSERFWRRDLAAREPGSMSVTIGPVQYAVIGVLPRTFRFLGEGAAWTEPADIWTPLERQEALGSRTSHGMIHVVARMRDGITIEQARIEMNDLATTLRAAHKQPTQAHAVQLTRLHDVVIRRAREPLQLLLYAAVAVLLVACLNLAGAILAQGLNRGRELSVRLALGATRWTIARHLLIEAATLGIPGAALGLALAAMGFEVLRSSAPGTFPRLDEVALDGWAIAAGTGLAGLTALVAGAIPAVVLSRRSQVERLRTHAASTGPRDQRRIWTGFVVVQVTLTVALLAGAGLLVRSFQAAMAVDLGYNPRSVLAVDVTLPAGQYADGARRIAFYDAALDRLRATPGVRSAGLTSMLPHVTSAYTATTARASEPDQSVFAAYRMIDAGYFETVGIRQPEAGARALREGAVIDRRLQEMLWKGAAAQGAQLTNSFARTVLTVTGVAGSVREWNQGDDITGTVYVDFHTRPDALASMHFVVRMDPRAAGGAQSIRQAIAAVDPLVPITIEPLESRTAEPLAERRLMLLLASGCGLAALLLAGSGVYAMVAFAVGRQMRESAIRLALGASPSSLRRRVILHGTLPTVAGIVGGLALAVPMGRAIRGQLFHVQPSDPTVLIVTVVAVVSAAVVASLLPARRAARIDPALSLRQE